DVYKRQDIIHCIMGRTKLSTNPREPILAPGITARYSSCFNPTNSREEKIDNWERYNPHYFKYAVEKIRTRIWGPHARLKDVIKGKMQVKDGDIIVFDGNPTSDLIGYAVRHAIDFIPPILYGQVIRYLTSRQHLVVVNNNCNGTVARFLGSGKKIYVRNEI
ncbi:MAG: hypothetical protein N3E38_02680, partial [Candidatus Aenigmarchaeota archaeon]|nr:hypothetical protein [Candidatus Aenigmarchaeota archaeon]